MKLDRSWTHKREHRLLSMQLVEASGLGFRAAVLPLLRAAFHETALDWCPTSQTELGEDHILWQSGEEVPLVTACLAFTGPELDDEDVRRAREAIRRFAGARVRTGLYLFLHNAESRSRQARGAIEEDLQEAGALNASSSPEPEDRIASRGRTPFRTEH